MGLFDRFRKQQTPAQPARLRARVTPEQAEAFGDLAQMSMAEFGLNVNLMEGLVCIPVIGESFHQDTLRDLREAHLTLGRTGLGFIAELVPEPSNANDPNAVMVMHGAHKVGYLPADVARDFVTTIRSLEAPVQCGARMVGGTPDKPNIGVVLNFTTLKAIKKANL